MGPTKPVMLELFPQCETDLSPPYSANLYRHSPYIFMVCHLIIKQAENFAFVGVQCVVGSIMLTGEQVRNCLPLCDKVRSTAVTVMCAFCF